MDKIIQDVLAEMDLAPVGDDFDRTNTRNDWVAYVVAYAGRAAAKVFRNEREGLDFRTFMVKAAALALSAIRAHDRGYC
jgi:hypothetical protein